MARLSAAGRACTATGGKASRSRRLPARLHFGCEPQRPVPETPMASLHGSPETKSEIPNREVLQSCVHGIPADAVNARGFAQATP